MTQMSTIQTTIQKHLSAERTQYNSMPSNHKEPKVFWVPIYDDWVQGWTPIIVGDESDNIKTNEPIKCIR